MSDLELKRGFRAGDILFENYLPGIDHENYGNGISDGTAHRSQRETSHAEV